ncbi:hypothetical protein [Ulvibacterium sp.]|uniref:hypothetical protein n=1 Tax=Ulvibacterium sp. TaxID=2665914 RepID=UPI003BAD7D19
MEHAKVLEMVLWKSKEGISTATAKKSFTRLNDFVRDQPGFISRKTSLAEDGRFLDIVLWTDMASAKAASEKAMKNKDLVEIFSTIDEREMVFQHFEVFNSTD